MKAGLVRPSVVAVVWLTVVLIESNRLGDPNGEPRERPKAHRSPDERVVVPVLGSGHILGSSIATEGGRGESKVLLVENTDSMNSWKCIGSIADDGRALLTVSDSARSNHREDNGEDRPGRLTDPIPPREGTVNTDL